MSEGLISFIKTASLNESQKNDILELEQSCRQRDCTQGNISITNSINFDGDIDCFYLLYEGDILVSFLTMFIPTPWQAEISALTLPSRRRRGHFTFLLSCAKEELKKYLISSVLFVCEPVCNDTKIILKKLGAEYGYSEYLLVYGKSKNNTTEGVSPLQLRKCIKDDFRDIVFLCAEIFNETYEDAHSLAEKSFNSKDISVFGAYLNNKLIGTCSVNFESADISIFGFGISPCYQGKGYGKLMLKLLIDKLHNMENINSVTLEVNSTNQSAFCLYTKSGFSIKAQFDYYRKTFD